MSLIFSFQCQKNLQDINIFVEYFRRFILEIKNKGIGIRMQKCNQLKFIY